MNVQIKYSLAMALVGVLAGVCLTFGADAPAATNSLKKAAPATAVWSNLLSSPTNISITTPAAKTFNEGDFSKSVKNVVNDRRSWVLTPTPDLQPRWNYQIEFGPGVIQNIYQTLSLTNVQRTAPAPFYLAPAKDSKP